MIHIYIYFGQDRKGRFTFKTKGYENMDPENSIEFWWGHL